MAGGNNFANLLKTVEHEDGPLLSIGEVAEYFEVHRDTIRRWGLRCDLPTTQCSLGEKGSYVWAYTQTDLRTLEEYANNHNPKGGRPPKQEED